MELILDAVSQEVPQYRAGLIRSGVWWHCGINCESFVTDPAGPDNLEVFPIVGKHDEGFQCCGGKTKPTRFIQRPGAALSASTL